MGKRTKYFRDELKPHLNLLKLKTQKRVTATTNYVVTSQGKVQIFASKLIFRDIFGAQPISTDSFGADATILAFGNSSAGTSQLI